MIKHSLLTFYRLIFITIFLFGLLGIIPVKIVKADSPPQIKKEFLPASIRPGNLSKLIVTVSNPNSFALQDVTWTDNFPSDIVIAPSGPNTAIVGCGAGVVTNGSSGTLSEGDTILKLSGATTAAATFGEDEVTVIPGTCSVTVDVTAVLPGNHVNTIAVSAVSANYISDPPTTPPATPITFLADASATLRVNLLTTPPQINKEFLPATILPGVTSKLSVSVYNPNSFALQDVTWTDNFPSDIVIAPAGPNTVIVGCGAGVVNNGSGGTLIAGNSSLKLSGATTAAATLGGDGITVIPGTCTVTVDVTAFVPGDHVNTIAVSVVSAKYISDHFTDPSTTTSIAFQNNASATLLVTPVTAPSLNKGISPNLVYAGETSVLTITITNNDKLTALTQVALDDTLPNHVVVADPPNAVLSAGCGAGALTGVGVNLLVAGDTAFHLAGATIASSSTCTITVNVKSDTPGNYFNTLGAGSLRTYQKVTNPALTQAQLTVQNIGIAKSFAPVNFQAGGNSMLTITLRNPDTLPLTSASLLDVLPANLTVVNDGTGSTNCGGGVVVTSNPAQITLTNGTIPGGTPSSPGTCIISAKVTSILAGTYINTVTADNLTFKKGGVDMTPSGQPASATLTVYGTTLGVGASKAFSPADIYPGLPSTLTIRLTAPADIDLTGVILTDTFPASMSVASLPNISMSGCSTGTLTRPDSNPLTDGDTTIYLSGASIARSQTCIISIDVSSNIYGPHINTILPVNLTDDQNRNLPSPVSATLTVRDISVAKSFAPTAVGVNGISTLTITLTNNYIKELTNITVNDTLPGTPTDGVVVAPTPNASTTCTGGVFNPTAGSQVLLMTGASIGASNPPAILSCTLSVDVKGMSSVNPPPEPQSYTNTIRIGDVTQTNPDATSNPTHNWNIASATLTINPPELRVNKYFNPILVTGGSSSTLSVDLVNPNATRLTGITFTDNLPDHMFIANPVAPNTGTCGGSINAMSGGTSYTFSGGILNGSQSCTLSLSVDMDVTGNRINTIDAYSVTSAEGATNTQETSATLTNLAGASLSKVFAPNPITNKPGSYSQLTFTIKKVGIAILTGLGMSDYLSGGMTIAPAGAPVPVNTCGGTLTAIPETTLVQLVDGTLAGSSTSSCIITVSVVVPSPANGNYQNCISVGSLIDNEGITNLRSACDTLKIDGIHNLFDPPSGAKVLNAAGLPELEWRMVWINDSNSSGINVQISDPIPTGTTYTPGSIHCEARGSSLTNTCNYDAVNDRIFWQGIIGPDLGAADEAAARNEVVITFRVSVSTLVDNVENKATSLTDRNGDGSFTDETITSASDSNLAVWNLYSGQLPGTGFSPDRATILPQQPEERIYQSFDDLWIEIPIMNIQTNIVGVPKAGNAWEVSWLGNNVGWLNETAMPGTAGNSVLTAHLYDANGLPGPFMGLKNLKYGDRVILHAWGQRFVYEVREVGKVGPHETAQVIRHEDLPWLTLVTCQDYDVQNRKYLARTVVHAVLIKMIGE